MHVSAQFGLVSDLDEGIVLAMHKQSDVIVALCELCLKRVSLARSIRDGLLYSVWNFEAIQRSPMLVPSSNSSSS